MKAPIEMPFFEPARPIATAFKAEDAYRFRHALLRDAAYQLHLPSDRARLHGFAIEAIEARSGGRAPLPASLDVVDPPAFHPHPTDPLAEEIVVHATLACDTPVLQLYLRRAAEHATRNSRRDVELDLWRRLSELCRDVELAESLRRAARAARQAGRHREAAALLDEAFEALPGTCHPRFRANLHSERVKQASATGRLLEIETDVRSALALHQELGDRRAEGVELGYLAIFQKEAGRVSEAERTFDRALTLVRDAGDLEAEGVVLNALANLYRQTGRRGKAERAHERVRAIARKSNDPRTEGISLGNIANLYRESGRVDLAKRSYKRALSIHREVGNRRSEGITLINLGSLMHETGCFREAEITFERALAILRDVGDRRSVGSGLNGIALVFRDTGRLKTAERALRQAIALHREVRNRSGEGGTLGDLAGLLHTAGRNSEADIAFVQALAVHRETGNEGFEGVHSCDHSLCQLSLGRHERARAAWIRGISLVRKHFSPLVLRKRIKEMRAACDLAGITAFEE